MAEPQPPAFRPYDASAFEGPRTCRKREVPEGLWMRCPKCEATLYTKVVVENLNVCPECDYHFRIDAVTRINYLADEGSF